MKGRDDDDGSRVPSSPSRRLSPVDAAFFAGGAVEVAQGLLGVVLARRIDGVLRRARIAETEAYLGPRDRASHSSKGRTRRTEVMFGPAGRAYVFVIYGIHPMLNVVVGREGDAEAVLLRGAEPLDGWDADLAGPGRLARQFAVTPRDNGLDLLAGDLTFSRDPGWQARRQRRKRVGVDYAGRWKDRLLRYVDGGSPVLPRLVR